MERNRITRANCATAGNGRKRQGQRFLDFVGNLIERHPLDRGEWAGLCARWGVGWGFLSGWSVGGVCPQVC